MRNAFSLVELSIVLVILGLLTGGILAGQSLIRASELRSFHADFQKFHAAYYSFRDKYFGVPGDLGNATDFWGSAGGTGFDADCYTAQTSGSRATCNGSGDSRIMHMTAVNNGERFMLWKHLANAGLIEGSFTGRSNGAAGTYAAAAGENLPRPRARDGYYDWTYLTSSNGNYFPNSRLDTNSMRIMGNNGHYSILRPDEAWNLDTKLDDGSPTMGRVIAPRNGYSAGANCTSSDAADATYRLELTAVGCYVEYLMR